MGAVRLLCLVALVAGCRAPKPPSFVGGVPLPLTQSGRGTVFVPVVANGHPLRFVLDTGATITAVTPATAELLGLHGEGNLLVNGTIPAQLTRIAALSVGTFQHANLRAAIVDLPEERRIDEHFDGVLGLDVLTQYDVAVDIPRKRLVFYAAGELTHSDIVEDMIRVDFQKSQSGLVEFKVDFDERGAVPAYLDLGAQRTFTNPATANWLVGPGNGAPERKPRGLNLGEVRWDQFSVVVEDLAIFAHWARYEDLAVIIGADLFVDRALVLAYKDSALFVARYSEERTR